MTGLSDLSGRTAVVTGAGSGIGQALASALCRESMRVAVVDIEAETADAAAAELRAQGAEAEAYQCDVSDPDSVSSMADAVLDRFGSVQLLCNNAGVFILRTLEQCTLEEWHWMTNVNIFGAIHSIRAFLPSMLDSGEPGHIVNTSSGAGLACGVPGLLPYAVTKYGLVALSEQLRFELDPKGIGVSVLCPGPVKTRILFSERLGPGGARPAPAKDRSSSATSRPRVESDTVQAAVDPAGVAQLVIDAVKANRPYVMTHADSGNVEERFKRILEAYEFAPY
jgi:NAD(P)-dependent dehydrogenase (short-subunit alcohol dehydrogenase family)